MFDHVFDIWSPAEAHTKMTAVASSTYKIEEGPDAFDLWVSVPGNSMSDISIDVVTTSAGADKLTIRSNGSIFGDGIDSEFELDPIVDVTKIKAVTKGVSKFLVLPSDFNLSLFLTIFSIQFNSIQRESSKSPHQRLSQTSKR